MIRIAIVDDEETQHETLKKLIEQFSQENDISFSIFCYLNGMSFLESNVEVDIVLMDVDMPHMNGIETAVQLRKKDEKVALIFITNMVEYAIKGYEVNAIDYILKPVNYARFSALLKKTLKRIISLEEAISIKTTDGFRKIYVQSILYIEIDDHLLYYHLEDEDILSWSSLSAVEKQLPEKRFVRCNKSCLVNLSQISGIENNNILVGKNRIKIPLVQGKKKAFLQAYYEYNGV